MKRIGIVGAGGFAREVLWLLDDLGLGDRIDGFYESDATWHARDVAGLPVRALSDFRAGVQEAVIAIGSPAVREALAAKLPNGTSFPTLIHPTVACSRRVEIGEGSVICAGSILTCDIVIGRHVHLNLMTTVGHDCELADFVTTAPAVNISGNCRIGRSVYIGTNACLREGLSIAPGAVIGMGAVVLRNVDTAGVYVGNPARSRVSS